MIADDTPWLLVSDIDDTLTGDDAALQALASALLRQRQRVRVALNSSRPGPSVARTRASVFPPDFPVDAVITALGTEIAIADVPVRAWSARFANWPAEAIFRVVAALGHAPHAPEFQTALKVSFAVAPEAQSAVAAALTAEGLPCRIISSGASDLDIVPPGAGKDTAALFLADHLGIPPARLIVAGDSGNDLSMFAVAACAIAVGNARGELLSAMPGDHSLHADGLFAAGVLEGLVHFGVLRGGKPATSA